MSYFPPHFMMPARQDVPENLANGASAYAKLQRDHAGANPWWLNYDQALDLQATPQQHKPMQMPVQVKHEQVDQQATRYGFDQVNYSGGQPSSIKSKPPVEKKYACDQCEYIATQKSSLVRHKQTQHEGIRQPMVRDGKLHNCELCPSQFTQLCSLNRHKQAKHSGQTFQCDQCEYIGTTALNTKLHKRSKHEGVRYPCDICGYQATQSGVLNRHKVQKHGFQPSEGHRSHNSGQMKQMRDPNAPKRPLSGFFHFSNVGRAKIKEANPDFTVADISKELSRRWHDLDDVTKAMFEEMANSDKARFQREKAEYNNTPNRGYKQTRSKRDPNAPKRPLCGFMYFSAEERANVRIENPNFAVGQIGKELGRRWAEAPAAVRDKYNAMASDDKERFVREKSEYQMTPYAGRWKMGQRAKKDPNAPKRSVHAFMWFSNDMRASIRAEQPGARVGDIAKELSIRWQQCTPEMKVKYEDMAHQDKQRYEKEKHEWHMTQRQNTMQNTPSNNTTSATSPPIGQSSDRAHAAASGTGYVPNKPQMAPYNQNNHHQNTQNALPPISHVHHNPPIAINHNVPAPTIRYGY